MKSFFAFFHRLFQKKESRELFYALTGLGEKKVGSFEGAQARQYIIESLKSEFPDFLVSEESFELRAVEKSHATLSFDDRREKVHLYENTGAHGNTCEGELFFAGFKLSKFRRNRAAGRIVVFKYSMLFHRVWQIKSAIEAGARGILIISGHNCFVRTGVGFPYHEGTSKIPAIGITGSQWNDLKKAQPKRILLNYETSFRKVTATNIICDSKSLLREKGTIVIGAHYDSWYSGAQDNCISVQMLFDLLRKLSGPHGVKLHHPVRLVFFDAEELGMLGSAFHAENNDLNAYKFYLNLEMAVPGKGSRLQVLFYSPQRIVKRSFSGALLFLNGVVPIPLTLFYRFSSHFPSDIDAFYKKGVPCISTYCSSKAYHTPLDSEENIRWRLYPVAIKRLLKILRRIDA